MYSYYFEGYVTLIDVVYRDAGRCNLILVAFMLFAIQIATTVLYVLKYCQADDLITCMTIINFVMPTIVIFSLCYLNCKFSGIPKIDAYKSRLKKMNLAVMIWSMTRITRAITSLWDQDIFLGGITSITGNKESTDSAAVNSSNSILMAMLMIVIFCTVELWPIWYVLDGNFVDIFLKQSVLIDDKDLNTPFLSRENSLMRHQLGSTQMY